MDSDPLRHLEFFSMPNNQTANTVDQSYLGGTPAQQHSIWDTAGLNVDGGLAVSPSSAPTSLSPDSVTQPSTGMSAMSPDFSASRSSAQGQGGQSRPVLAARSRTRDAHERKRSRLSVDSTPLDSVDYWIDFDKNESLGSIPEGYEPSRQGDGRSRVSMARRPASHAATKRGDFLDDSAMDNALSDDDGFSSINLADHLSRIDSAPPRDVPPREGLYSTPLSWERPEPGIRMESLIGLNNQAMNEAEQRRLIAIAMNPGPSMGGLGSNINLNFSGLGPGMPMTFGAGLGSNNISHDAKNVSPPHDRSQSRPTPPNFPRKQGSMSEKGKEKLKAGDRTAHNDIERKYRTNLKDKISELRDAVPALRTTSENGGDDDDDTQPSRSAKVSKGTVLTKATEYIHLLEKRNKQIVTEHRELSRRLQAFEHLLNTSARQSYTMPTYSRTLFDPRGFC